MICKRCKQETIWGFKYRGVPVCQDCYKELYPIKDSRNFTFGSWAALKRLGKRPIAAEIPLTEWPKI